MATGTRLSINGGAPRAYMTYGYPEEPAFYAPIVGELVKLGVSFRAHKIQANDSEVVVSYQGKQIAVWPVVSTRVEVPDTGETPCVLIMGGNSYLPVWKMGELLNLDVKWDRKENLMAVVPGKGGIQVKALPGDGGRPAPRVVQRPEVPIVALSGVTLAEKSGGVEVRIQASGPVNVKTFTVKNPNRLVVDFLGAKWDKAVVGPDPLGIVTKTRVGQFEETTARLALSIDSLSTKITTLRVENDAVVAIVGAGTRMASADSAPEIREVLRKRLSLLNTIGSRSGEELPGGGIEIPFPDNPGRNPGVLPDLPPIGAAIGNLRGKVICLDAGHGGHSTGAVGLDSQEKDLCLKMCLEFRRAMEGLGATVIMSRDDDTFVSLEGRVAFSNNRNPDLFISIHCNSMPKRNTASGSETYYHTDQSALLARALHRRVVRAVQGRDGGIRNRGFYVIKYTKMPSVLLEIAFINNTQDELLLSNPIFHSNLANSLTQGVLDYFAVAPQ
jgi:N-acetylmuramoyl-L-alanine amidase